MRWEYGCCGCVVFRLTLAVGLFFGGWWWLRSPGNNTNNAANVNNNGRVNENGNNVNNDNNSVRPDLHFLIMPVREMVDPYPYITYRPI